ncbi:DUF1275 domain protein [Pseudohyphozyma bogoriensis]|nr:DUF1275 domain protein [Pseudohyphozyma bogoriensis]
MSHAVSLVLMGLQSLVGALKLLKPYQLLYPKKANDSFSGQLSKRRQRFNQSITLELSVLQMFRGYSNIIQLQSFDNRKPGGLPKFIVSDYCELELENFIDHAFYHKKMLPPSLIQLFLWQIMVGVNHLHAAQLVHRDLKEMNVMVKIEPAGLVCFISDFGAAATFGSHPETLLGSPACVAPEAHLLPPIHPSLDVWAFGVMWYKYVASASRGLLAFSPRSLPRDKEGVANAWAQVKISLFSGTQSILAPETEADVCALASSRPDGAHIPWHITETYGLASLHFGRSVLNVDPAHRPALSTLFQDPYFHTMMGYPHAIPTHFRSLARVGSFTTGQLAHRLGIGKRRWYLFIISLFQSIIVLISAILIYTSAITLGQPSDLALISIMSIAFGSQGAAGRLLASTPITTVVVTSAMFDLFADKDLFAPLGKNVARNQRVAFILVFFVGTIVGGATLRHVGVPFTLVLAGIFKFAAVMLFLVAPGKTRGSNMVKAEEGFANDGGPGESAQTGGSAARQEP